MGNVRLNKIFPLFTLGEIQLLAQGIHIIGEQNRVDKKLLRTWKRLVANLAEALDQAADREAKQLERDAGKWKLEDGGAIMMPFEGEYVQIASMSRTSWSYPDDGKNKRLRELTEDYGQLIVDAVNEYLAKQK